MKPPHERFDDWWDANAADVEDMIVVNGYARQWAYGQRGPLRAWIHAQPTSRIFTERGWKTRVKNWLSNGWYKYMTEAERQRILADEAGGEPDYSIEPGL